MEHEEIILRCMNCGTKNRIPRSRVHDRPACGKCHAPLDEMIIRCLICGTKNRLAEDHLDARPRCGRCGTPLVIAGAQNRPVEVTDATFAAEVILTPGPVVVLCWAPWCGHCKKMLPVLDELAAKYAGGVKTAKLNTDENSLTAGQYDISGIPALLLFRDGKLVNRLVGALPKEEIEKHLLSVMKKN